MKIDVTIKLELVGNPSDLAKVLEELYSLEEKQEVLSFKLKRKVITE